MFDIATRLKLRFNTEKGLLTVEDLWDLPLIGHSICLDNLAKQANTVIMGEKEDSFVVKKSKTSLVSTLKLDILKYIIEYKLKEIEEKEIALTNKTKKDKLGSIIEEMEDEELRGNSLKDLKRMYKNL